MTKPIIISLGNTKGSKKTKNSKRISASLAVAFDEEVIHLEPQKNAPSSLQHLELVKNNSTIHLVSSSFTDIQTYCDLILKHSQLVPGNHLTIVLWQSYGGKHDTQSPAAVLAKLLHQKGISANIISTKGKMERFHKTIKHNLERNGSIGFLGEQHREIRVFQCTQNGLFKSQVDQPIYFTPKSISPANLKNQKLVQNVTPDPSTQRILPAKRSTQIKPLPQTLARTKIKVPKYQSNDLVAPAIFHFIWVGGPIPAHYLSSLKKITEVAKKSGFEVNLWVDSPLNYHRTAVTAEIDAPNLKLRDINELLEKMKEAPIYTKNNNFVRFISYVNREMIGHKNLASVSDLIRYEILRQFGGYYFDTDLEFVLDEHSRFIPDELPLGIKLRTNLEIIPLDTINAYHTGKADTNNDLIASLPNHPIINQMIEQCLNVYQLFDTLEARGPDTYLNKMDKKRFPYSMPSKLPLSLQENRFNLTLACGPELILLNTPNYVTELALPGTEENVKKIESMLLGSNPTVANVVVRFHSDLNWSLNRFELIVINDDKKQLSPKFLKKLTAQNDDCPILYKQGNQFFLYGCVGKKWQITPLSNKDEIMAKVPWPHASNAAIRRKPEQLPAFLYNVIAAAKAHTPKRPKTPAFEAESVVSRFRLFGATSTQNDTPPTRESGINPSST